MPTPRQSEVANFDLHTKAKSQHARISVGLRDLNLTVKPASRELSALSKMFSGFMSRWTSPASSYVRAQTISACDLSGAQLFGLTKQCSASATDVMTTPLLRFPVEQHRGLRHTCGEKGVCDSHSCERFSSSKDAALAPATFRTVSKLVSIRSNKNIHGWAPFV